MSRRDLDDLLGAFALDALDDDERHRLDAAIADDHQLAERASALQRAVALLGEEHAAPPPIEARARLLAAVGRVPSAAAAIIASTPLDAYAHQTDALAALLAELSGADWSQRARPYDWTVHGLVAHLLVIDRYMGARLGTAPAQHAADGRDHLSIGGDQIELELRRPPAATAADWRDQVAANLDHLRTLDDEAMGGSLQMHQWPFDVRSALVARSFEIWTHADDIRRATGRAPDVPAPSDLRVMSDVSVQTLPLVYPLVSDRRADGEVRVVLTGDGGGTWDLRLGSGGERVATIVADVVDYCRLAAQRIELADLVTDVAGDRQLADSLLLGARVFAV